MKIYFLSNNFLEISANTKELFLGKVDYDVQLKFTTKIFLLSAQLSIN